MGCWPSKDEGSTSVEVTCLSKPALDLKLPRMVMDRYKMFMDKEAVMGEGTSSICRRGQDPLTGDSLAIKVYKEQQSSKSSRVKSVTLQKFRRQIKVLQELQEPFQTPSDGTLWHKTLDNVEPGQVFVRLIDYSKDAKGEPGPDPADNTMYVVTELAQYSLKDFLANLREKKKSLPPEKVKKLCKAIMVAMASLHAKGFVHLDMKPENLMMFNGRLKVIDVDGCVKMNTKINIQDSSISFSPCYCAPEWARFLISEDVSYILALPGLDVWSVGMTLCELITHDAILKTQYGNFLRNAHNNREAGFLFMEWLGGIKRLPVPRQVGEHDKAFLDLLSNWLLVCKAEQRKNCAQSLSHEFIADAEWEVETADVEHKGRPKRQEDPTTGVPLHNGVLFKLNSNGDPSKAEQWIQRDMWIAQNHSLCYYSQKENKKLVLIDGSQLGKASFEHIDAARPFAFRCIVSEDKESGVYGLAAESEAEMDDWITHFKSAGRHQMLATFQLGADMAADLQAFKMTVKNRRQKVADNNKDQFEPLFKAKLWKLKGDGDSMKEDDWFEREMWIAKNGSLVYFSPKEHMDLVYYTAADIHRANVVSVENGRASKPFTFQVQLPPVAGVEFAPGEFAAESEALRKQWMSELRKHTNA
jgi:serine/threonine protein kinase